MPHLATRKRLVGSFSGALTGDLVALYNGSADGTTYHIGAGTKTFAGTWTPYVSNPVISPGSGGTWDDATVKDPCLLKSGATFIAYYAGFDGTNYRIGRATASAYTGSWTKAGGNPLINLGAGGSFDAAGCSFPTILQEPSDTGKEWKCWYAATDGSGVQSVGYAYSSDGLSWTKVGQVLTKGGAGTWEDEGVLPMAIYKVGATYNLFYGGRQGTTNPRWQGGVATFTDPEGTYTKSGSNPVLLARFNDAGTSRVLTANTASGSAVVTVASTAAWNVGEPMVLADTNSETNTWEILTIDSGTQITMAGNANTNFTTTEGATMRPFAFNSVLPRTVKAAAAGGFEMFGTPFQPVDDLTVGGSSLREGSMRWTSTNLTGPWSYDYSTGLLFPLYPANTGWDKFSAENPSVLAV